MTRCEEVEEWFKQQQSKREEALVRKKAKLLLLEEEDTVALIASESSYTTIRRTKKRCMLRLGKVKNITGLGRTMLSKFSLLGNSVTSYSACPDNYMDLSSSSTTSPPTKDDTECSALTSLNTAETSSSSISISSSGSQDGREDSPLLEFDDANVDSSDCSSSSISLSSSVLDDYVDDDDDDDDDDDSTDNITIDDDNNEHITTTAAHHLLKIVCGMKYIYDSTSQEQQLGYYTGQIRTQSKLPHGMGTWRDENGYCKLEGHWYEGHLYSKNFASSPQEGQYIMVLDPIR